MANGRKPVPSHLKLVRGNPGKRAINRSEPKPRRERPSAPAHISDTAREVWGQAVLTLDEMGVLTAADVFAIEVLCEAIADHRDAGETIAAEGRFYETTTKEGSAMWRLHPAVALRSDADRRVRGWCAEFGLTPSARSRIETTPKQAEDPSAKYLTG